MQFANAIKRIKYIPFLKKSYVKLHNMSNKPLFTIFETDFQHKIRQFVGILSCLGKSCDKSMKRRK
jgi:hypothetical protein